MTSVITFYSYKGGVGRTMSLVNIATILARKYKVLIVDWDLESAGVETYFDQAGCDISLNQMETKDGLIQLITSTTSADSSENEKNWRKYIFTIKLSDDISLDLLSSGSKSTSYKEKLYDLNWKEFYEKRGGAFFLDRIRNEWIEEYDFILIDSRTGLADIARVCTVHMPDVLVAVFTSNFQSLEVARVARDAQKYRSDDEKYQFDRDKLIVYPLPSCIQMGNGDPEEEKWFDRFVEKFKDFYSDGWLPYPAKQDELDREEIKDILKFIAVPKVSAFHLGEKIPTIDQYLGRKPSRGFHQRSDITRGYEITAHVIADRFERLQWLSDLTSPEASEVSSGNQKAEKGEKQKGSSLPFTGSQKQSNQNESQQNNILNIILKKFIQNPGTLIWLVLILALITGLSIFIWNKQQSKTKNSVLYYRVDDRSKSAEGDNDFKILRNTHCILSHSFLKKGDVETIVEFSDTSRIVGRHSIDNSTKLSDKSCSYLSENYNIQTSGQKGTSIIDVTESILNWKQIESHSISSFTPDRVVISILLHNEEHNSPLRGNTETQEGQEYLKYLLQQATLDKNTYLIFITPNESVNNRLTEISKDVPNVSVCSPQDENELKICLEYTFGEVRP